MDFNNYSPALVLLIVVSLALAPFVAVMVTSFTKIVVVLSLLRNALGLQQVPPNVVINGLAIVLSIYVMYPVILDTNAAISARLAGQPMPASVQAQVDAREAAERARRAARAQPPAAAAASPAATTDAPSSSPAAADALQAEAERTAAAGTAPAPAPQRGERFQGVTGGVIGATEDPQVPADGRWVSASPPPPPAPLVPEGSDLSRLLSMVEAGKEPLRTFLIEHAHDAERAFFLRSAQMLLPPERRADLSVDDFIVVIPAFTVSELTAAFQIGFLIFLPFLIIDLVVANILLALGMMMMSPTTVSLPFKLLLFVLVDGWAKLVHGLVLTYAG
ncbi:EscR/YscR/HrcR family type III secretion system export apparatus protein [Luteimonas huabeiensis]|uniref:EscR/YscR/HrcR family type III secretion system export apparatus protein n=1 Tax=Luteimonas huabeiensis TaxID=1244513 RepID=UPI000466DF7F|nr:EscR/YscR/HrcR family type III secretion system export apparatus protein [Luteimonas huabeiensis]